MPFFLSYCGLTRTNVLDNGEAIILVMAIKHIRIKLYLDLFYSDVVQTTKILFNYKDFFTAMLYKLQSSFIITIGFFINLKSNSK